MKNQLTNQNIFSNGGVRITAFELRIWIVIKRFRKIYKIIIQSINSIIFIFDISENVVKYPHII